MKTFRKSLILLLAISMVFGMATPALALDSVETEITEISAAEPVEECDIGEVPEDAPVEMPDTEEPAFCESSDAEPVIEEPDFGELDSEDPAAEEPASDDSAVWAPVPEGPAIGEPAAADDAAVESADGNCIRKSDFVVASERANSAALPAESLFSSWEWEVLKLVNEHRYTYNLNPLTGFSTLQKAGDIRANELTSYFSHYRPDGTLCFTVLSELGISRTCAGENIAFGYTAPTSAVNAWMNSEGHRANILNSNFAHMGVGYQSGYAVQLFIGTGGNTYTSFSLVLPAEINSFPAGTSLSEMGIYAKLTSSVYGTCYLPILPEYCTGYDPYQSGKQTVTVSVLGFTATFTITLDIPVPEKPYKIANIVTGVHVYWRSTADVEKYGVWRSETGKDGTYNWIANTTATHYADTTVESAKTYYYKISALIGSTNRHSEKSEAYGITFVSTPDITSRANTPQGIQLGWNKIQGATGYAIYRKVGDDAAWVRVATIEGGNTLTWLDTAVKSQNGTVFKYTIRALYGTTLSGCRSTGRTMVRLFTPTVSTCVPHATNPETAFVRWDLNNKATGYEVRFLVDGNVYHTFTVTTKSTVARSFSGLDENLTYTVQVRSYYKTTNVGTYYSAWSSPKTLTFS